jgi:uncharacterized membrane protein YjfL (UPF0719 family)
MNQYLFLILFLAADFFVAIVIIFLIVRIFSGIFIRSRSLEFLQQNNMAASILLVAIVISTAILCANTITTVHQNLDLSAHIPDNIRTAYFLQTIGLGFLQLILSVVIALLIAFLSTKLFAVLTKGVDEYREIREKNNVSIGLLLGGIVIALTIFIGFPFSALVSSLIPLPEYNIPL